MTAPVLSAADVAAITARADAATDGPWRFEGAYARENIYSTTGAPDGAQWSVADQASATDAAFIAAARTDAARLIRERP